MGLTFNYLRTVLYKEVFLKKYFLDYFIFHSKSNHIKLFLSWSGPKSKKTAEVFNSWIKQVIQFVDPWMSTEIEKGKRWSVEISNNLEETKFGIICLTKQNLKSEWILFEAGALSKTKDANVSCFLLDLSSPAEVTGPLSQFQHTQNSKNEIYKLLKTINNRLTLSSYRPLEEKVLSQVFELFYPQLEKSLRSIIEENNENETLGSFSKEREERDILEEILDIVRGISIDNSKVYSRRMIKFNIDKLENDQDAKKEEMVLDQINQLLKLREVGLLSPDEFEIEKGKLLN